MTESADAEVLEDAAYREAVVDLAGDPLAVRTFAPELQKRGL